MEKKRMGEIGFLIATVVAVVVAFYFYMYQYFEVNDNIYKQISEMLYTIGVVEEKQNVLIIILGAVAIFLNLIVGFVIYKIIFRLSGVCSVQDMVLFQSVATSYIIEMLVGYFLLKWQLGVMLTVITNFLEMIIVYFMLYDKIKANLWKAVLFRCILATVNVFVYFLQ